MDRQDIDAALRRLYIMRNRAIELLIKGAEPQAEYISKVQKDITTLRTLIITDDFEFQTNEERDEV